MHESAATIVCWRRLVRSELVAILHIPPERGSNLAELLRSGTRKYPHGGAIAQRLVRIGWMSSRNCDGTLYRADRLMVKAIAAWGEVYEKDEKWAKQRIRQDVPTPLDMRGGYFDEPNVPVGVQQRAEQAKVWFRTKGARCDCEASMMIRTFCGLPTTEHCDGCPLGAVDLDECTRWPTVRAPPDNNG